MTGKGSRLHIDGPNWPGGVVSLFIVHPPLFVGFEGDLDGSRAVCPVSH